MGQLLFVAHGFAITVAGIVISIIGSTTVFVPEDLEFMRVTGDDLWGAHPQLVPLVAHDRAVDCWDAAFSADSKYLVTGGGDGRMFV